MDKEIRDRWIAALRSGKYRQATEQLHSIEHDSYCCLGVLCDISGVGLWHGSLYETSHEGCLSAFPSTLLRDYGISLQEENCLAAMNDGGGSFETIAAHIEANL